MNLELFSSKIMVIHPVVQLLFFLSEYIFLISKNKQTIKKEKINKKEKRKKNKNTKKAKKLKKKREYLRKID